MRTYNLQNKANPPRPSATALASIKQDHLLAENRQMWQSHQQQLVHQLNRMTYLLRAGKYHKAISNSSCTYQPGSLTYWGQVIATRPLATALVSINQDHLHAEGRQIPQGHQQQLLHLSTKITYILRAAKCHKAISNSLWTYQLGLLTSWG